MLGTVNHVIYLMLGTANIVYTIVGIGASIAGIACCFESVLVVLA